jgi:carboxymethylenebutenolidase
MCDELTNRDAEEYLRRNPLTRREFTRRGTAAAIALMLPPVVNALDVVEEEVMVETPDGEADCYWVHPESGRHAAVIVWPDVMSIRPAFRAMGKRLAESGYSVLVVNPYYRTARGTIMPEGKSFRDPGIRDMLMPHARALSPETCVSDGRAFVKWLDQQPSVDTGRKIGDRIGAGGSFHGGRLATDAEDSPHLLAPQMKAAFLIAIAENDDERNPDEKVMLREAFDAAGVEAEIEVYEGTLHGWCPPDSTVYNEDQAERAWSRLLDLFERKLA